MKGLGIIFCIVRTRFRKIRPVLFFSRVWGNFLFYTWVLKEEFPDAIILVPSWGTGWHRGSTAYLKNMLANAEHCTGVRLRKPWLMGISAGGRGGFMLYNKMSREFRGYVCIANAPETFVARSLRSDLRILMLNGSEDAMVPIAVAGKQMRLAKRRVPTIRYHEINGNHFFMLSDRENTFGMIREFMKDVEGQKR